MIRLSWAIEQLEEAQRDMMAITAIVETRLQECQNRIQIIIDELQGEQAEYRAKIEDDNSALFEDKNQRRGL